MNPLARLPFHSCAAVALIGLAGCQPAAEDDATNQVDANQASLNLPAVPLPQPPMGRAELLAAVARAASDAASGAGDTAAQRSLDGAQFELRIRFGCRGPAPDLAEAVLGWTFDPQERVLRVRAEPTISMDGEIAQQVLRQVDGAAFEAVEGFWIPRPWLLDPVCPAVPQGGPSNARPGPLAEALARASRQPDAPTAASVRPPVEDVQESQAPPPAWPKVGIAQFFTDTDPRTRRRDMRPYQIVKTLAQGQTAGTQGFNLVLSGRLRALPGRKVIACVARGADTPPDCIVSAEFHRVWMERPDSREVLAEWGAG